jgi:hypothetical protein
MSKLVFSWNEKEDAPIWYNHYATIYLKNRLSNEVYELNTTKFNPANKKEYSNKQELVGAFKTLQEAKSIAEKLYEVEMIIRETAVY